MLQTLLGNAQNALLGAITEVFLIGAGLTAAAVVVNFFLREVSLSSKSVAAEQLGTQTFPPLDLEKCCPQAASFARLNKSESIFNRADN